MIPICENYTPRLHSLEMGGHRYLVERMTFDQLLRVSDPKRVARSETVRGPALDLEAFTDSLYYHFNFKSHPSTTGLRHRGYIKFFKPKNLGKTLNSLTDLDPDEVTGNIAAKKLLQHVECLVDCTCPDMRFRWSWALKQKGSGRVGDDSLNKAWNKAPRITNPGGKVGACKHVLALRNFIYNQVSSFEGSGDESISKRLAAAARIANKRSIDYKGEISKAKDRERGFANTREKRRQALLTTEPDEDIPIIDPPLSDVPPTSAEDREANIRNTLSANNRTRNNPTTRPNESLTPTKVLSMKTTMKLAEATLKNLTVAASIVEEIGEELPELPPVDGAASGAAEGEVKDEGSEALSLLGEIRDLLSKIASEEETEIEDEEVDLEDTEGLEDGSEEELKDEVNSTPGSEELEEPPVNQ